LEPDEGISAACGWQWPTGVDHGLVAVWFPAIAHGAAAASDVPLVSRLIPETSRARVGVESIPAFPFVWWKAYAECPWITWTSTEVAMITDSHAATARSLNLGIVGWLRVVDSRACAACCQDSESSFAIPERRKITGQSGQLPCHRMLHHSYRQKMAQRCDSGATLTLRTCDSGRQARTGIKRLADEYFETRGPTISQNRLGAK
jgi:hypothetical protein